MKKLTRLKLINWHRFSDVTIDFGDSTLISGENGAGKSTLLDAIQFVVTCSTNHFNKAAHENGKRKLTGYIRCKTGRENHPYERTGEISAHVALEFYEESKEKYFVIGAVIDSATEGQETVVRYLMDNVMLEDEMFKIGNRPRTITEFRSFNNKNIKLFAKTNAEGKKMMKQRFGRIEDKFFQLIPKALAFKPIDDIKDFVYSYVLDEKEVNIDHLRENVRSYQELEKTLEGVKNRIEKLSEIECHHKAVVDCIQSDRMYEYFMAQSDLDLTKEQIGVLQDEIRRESYRLEQLNAKCSSMKKELENKEEVRTLLLAELNANSDFQTLEKQKKYLKELQEKEEIQYQEKKRLLESGKKAGQKVKRLLEIPDVDECMKQYDELLHRLKDTEDVVSAQELIDRAIAYKKHMSTKLQRKNLEIQSRLNEIAADLQETEQRISNLKQHRFSYPSAVQLLMSRVEQELLKIGRTAKPRILCEMLEITDETWRNAVEGYLNTQRFYVLVEPEHFDIALGIYEKLRREKKAYGVGLINSGKLEEYDIAPAGSLATVVESKSIYAKRYVNMVLGKVHMCKRVDELKQYAAVQERLVNSELLNYEEKVRKAKLSAEEEFREQFLSKLQENMKQAQGEFRELNKALKDITFSNERYEFLYLPSKSYGKYYDMIMDDFNVVQGESIFSGLFHENHKEVIDELFSKLALDQDNGIKALDEFTDYRTYMDYDIKITHEDGSYSLYSKVCEEKSGGETQTPFYVTVAASFVQLYNNNIGGEAIGLVMFDEAFNNMDDERIGAVLEFMNRLPLQIVIAAPPDKIQYIGPKMQETLLVLTDDKVSFVEEYRYASGRK